MPAVPSRDHMLAGEPVSSASDTDPGAIVGQTLAVLAEIIATNALLLPAITELGQSLLARGPGAAPTALPANTSTLSGMPFEEPVPGMLPQHSAGASDSSAVHFNTARPMVANAVAPTRRRLHADPKDKSSQWTVQEDRPIPATMVMRPSPRHATSSGPPNDRHAPVLTMLSSAFGITEPTPFFGSQGSFSPNEPPLSPTPELRNIDEARVTQTDAQMRRPGNSSPPQQGFGRNSRTVNTTTAVTTSGFCPAANPPSADLTDRIENAETEIREGARTSKAKDLSDAVSASTRGSVLVDGASLGRWIMDHLAKEASSPISGMTSADPRVTAAYPGAPIGT